MTGEGRFAIVNLETGASLTYQGHGKQLCLVRRDAGHPARRWRFDPVVR